MSLTRARAAALFLFAAVLTVSGQQSSPLNRPWPPDVQKVSPDSPALSPAEALKTFYMPPGYQIELVASEPLIQDPIVMDWDRQGRLWVVEMPGFVPNLQAPEPYMEPIGKVVVLEDTDRDGVMDKRTVFADGLVLARSLKVLDRGVLVGEPPNVWLMRDTNGDLQDGHQGARHRPVRPPRGAGRAERQRLLLGHGQLDAHRQQRTSFCG